MNLDPINIRYSELAETTCCLSCGGAINHAKAQRGEVCVDLGSGRGTDVIRLAEIVGDEGFVYGIDIAEGMITKAQKNAEKLGITNVRFIRAALESLPIDSQSVNLIISNCTLNHAENKQAVWNEIYRILKKGGRFAISDIYALQPVPEEYKNNPAMVAECWAGSVTKDEYFRILDNAGFSSVEILEESEPYEKGKIVVASFTIAAQKNCCC
jgi:ubiquinone/menaquinone biosynthesis C-methylase UbiE